MVLQNSANPYWRRAVLCYSCYQFLSGQYKEAIGDRVEIAIPGLGRGR